MINQEDLSIPFYNNINLLLLNRLYFLKNTVDNIIDLNIITSDIMKSSTYELSYHLNYNEYLFNIDSYHKCQFDYYNNSHLCNFDYDNNNEKNIHNNDRCNVLYKCDICETLIKIYKSYDNEAQLLKRKINKRFKEYYQLESISNATLAFLFAHINYNGCISKDNTDIIDISNMLNSISENGIYKIECQLNEINNSNHILFKDIVSIIQGGSSDDDYSYIDYSEKEKNMIYNKIDFKLYYYKCMKNASSNILKYMANFNSSGSLLTAIVAYFSTMAMSSLSIFLSENNKYKNNIIYEYFKNESLNQKKLIFKYILNNKSYIDNLLGLNDVL